MTFQLIHTKGLSILEQLRMEESLLHNSQENILLINEGTTPAIVVGISGKVEELIDTKKALHLPIIRRFSGGGTVIVDGNTLFITFICKADLHPSKPFPETVMRWSEELYKPVFDGLDYRLRENDYVIGEKKCGGNAQSFKKERYLHHTSWLWDFEEEKMDLLLHPKKTPTYRAGRVHADFLCKLKDFFESKEQFTERLKAVFVERFGLQSFDKDSLIQTGFTSRIEEIRIVKSPLIES